MERTIVYHAESKKEGMSLGELSQFVQEALRSDIDPRTKVRVFNGMRQQIQRLEVKG